MTEEPKNRIAEEQKNRRIAEQKSIRTYEHKKHKKMPIRITYEQKNRRT